MEAQPCRHSHIDNYIPCSLIKKNKNTMWLHTSQVDGLDVGLDVGSNIKAFTILSHCYNDMPH